MARSNTQSKEVVIKAAQDDQAVLPLSRFEKMIETGIWTSRLNKRLNVQLAQLTALLGSLEQKTVLLAEVSKSDQQAELVAALKQELDQAYRSVLPEVVEISVVAADCVFSLDSELKEAKLKVADARNKAVLLEEKLSKSFFERAVDLGILLWKRKRRTTELKVSAPLAPRYAIKGYYDVDNSDTAFSIFENWVSVFNANGRRYGSSEPILHDALENLLELHSHVSLKDKTILELGPFEGVHTKQLVDFGAKQVVALEANPEAFLKCLVVKNELALDNVSFVFGDFNTLLAPDKAAAFPKFDCCIASGVLYHMEDPLYTIDLIAASAPVVYVWSQVASEARPAGAWREVQDSEGRSYKVKENHYEELKHWGGVGRTSLWLTPDAIQQAFIDRGFAITFFEDGQGPGGQFISFLARRN